MDKISIVTKENVWLSAERTLQIANYEWEALNARMYKKCKYIGTVLIENDNAAPKSEDNIGIAEGLPCVRRNRKISLESKNRELLCSIGPGSASWTSDLRQ